MTNTSTPCFLSGDSSILPAKNFDTMVANHFDVSNAHVYDATNPAARDFYWNDLAGKLFALGLGRILAR